MTRTKYMLFVLLVLASFIRADGMIIPDHPEDKYPLILNHYVTVAINDTYATTRVEQEFQNDGYRDIEGTYVFPVPFGGVRDVKLVVEGKTLEGRMLSSTEAKELYQKYVMERKDASLLEYVGRDVFSSKVVLPKGKKVKVIINYEQIIDSSSGVYSYFYPLSPERYSTKPIDPVNVTVTIDAAGKIGFIYSPTHNITISRLSDKKAVVNYYESKVIPDRDFQVYYGVTERDYDVKLLANKRDNEGYFLLFVYPSLTTQESIPKDVIFVLDTSGSMEGTKLEYVKKALKYGLDKLNGNDKFDIIAFSSSSNSFSGNLKGTGSISDAQKFIDSLVAEGATNLYDPQLKAVNEFGNDTRVHIIVLLTDGQDTTGHSDAAIINDLKAKKGDWKIFTFGVGEDVDFELLDRLANEFGDGIPVYVKSDADLEATLKSFYDRISNPLLLKTNVTIEQRDSFSPNQISTYDIYPRKIPDVFLGTQLTLAGKYAGYGNARVVISGEISGVKKNWSYDVTFPSQASNNFVERIWALKKVGYLLDQVALEGETAELKEQIKQLAIKYGIPTPYTSYLVISPEGKESQRDLGIAVIPAAGGTLGVANSYKSAVQAPEAAYQIPQMKIINDKTFVSIDGIWKDTSCMKDKADITVTFGSQEYLELIKNTNTANYLSVGSNALICLDKAIQIVPSYGAGAPTGTGIPSNNTIQPGEQTTTQPPAQTTPPITSLLPIGVILVAFIAYILIQILRRPSFEEGDEEIYKALSSNTRREILSTLQEGDRTPTDISYKLNKSKATIVEHLDKLMEAKLVEKIEADGKKWVFYRLTSKAKSLLRKGG